jgi:hypothetical protein
MKWTDRMASYQDFVFMEREGKDGLYPQISNERNECFTLSLHLLILCGSVLEA